MPPQPGRTRCWLAASSLLALSAGFYADAWGVTRPGWFERFQRGSECHVLGRLVKSRQDGLGSAAGLMGIGVVHFEEEAERPRYGVRFRRADLATGIHLPREGDFPGPEQMDEQFDAYVEDRRFEIYSPYLSQSGGQGLLYAALDALLPLSARAKLSLFELLASLLSAGAITLVVLWFAAELSPGVAAWVMLTAVPSQWLVGFGGKLWWSLWAFYLPFLVLLRHETARRPGAPASGAKLVALACGAVFAKCLLNGYEYITTTLVMMAVPGTYCALRDRVGVRAWLARMAWLGLGAAAAILASVAILVAQVAVLGGSVRFGLRHLAFKFAVRTDVALDDLPPSYAASLSASHWSVLETYLRLPYYDFRGRWPAFDAWLPDAVLALPYGVLLILFAAASLLVARLARGEPDRASARRHAALVWTTWFSLLAPLSWILLFKAHSYEHTHMNGIVWQMPFSLLGFAVVGVAARLSARRLGRR